MTSIIETKMARELVRVYLVLSVLVQATYGGSYEYDSEYLVPEKCPPCDAKSCPQLTYCAGVVVKDHCGCCNRCSSDLFQPYTDGKKDQAAEKDHGRLPKDWDTSLNPAGSVVDVCAKRKCPKFKVCVKNIQGLAICACPSEFICGRKNNNKNGEKTSEICGTDGKTYQSRCHLKIANCNSHRRIKRYHDGPCIESNTDFHSRLIPLDRATDTRVHHRKPTNDNSPNVNKHHGGKITKDRKKNRKGNRKGRKERKKKRNRNDKNPRKESNRRRRSRRLNKRNRNSHVFLGKHAYMGRQPIWSESQVRKSKI